ncbi:MAG: DUF951 domain-containing protein [Candidatus Izemoplasmatales bacterium]|jgi:hypothetical protein|nr:DUF951 domain-containing protein [Candidatus Izemoplasmatales bacterium]MDD3865749.1 DUF951 domain-containing protein [Candidatus Izemoplasmatales bacterium]
MINEIKQGSVVVLKKGHPCGANKWEIIRFGVDCKIKCLGCGRIVLIERMDLRKAIKKILEEETHEEPIE